MSRDTNQDPAASRATLNTCSKTLINFKNSDHKICCVPDPYNFGPLGSGSVNQRYGFGSRSIPHQVKIERETFFSIVS